MSRLESLSKLIDIVLAAHANEPAVLDLISDAVDRDLPEVAESARITASLIREAGRGQLELKALLRGLQNKES